MESTEKWLPVVGYEGLYEVSDHGRVRSLDRVIEYVDGRKCWRPGKMLSPSWAGSPRHPRLSVKIRDGNCRTVHSLVLTAFVGPCPDGMEGCHNDGDPANNRVTNLRWDTHTENMRDVLRHGRHPHANKKHCIRGHVLAAPNLRRAPEGNAHYRRCLACGTEAADAHRQGRAIEDDRADALYSRIMAGLPLRDERDMCDLGHPLIPGNLVEHLLHRAKQPSRTCRACHNAKNRARKRGIAFDPAVADSNLARYVPVLPILGATK